MRKLSVIAILVIVVMAFVGCDPTPRPYLLDAVFDDVDVTPTNGPGLRYGQAPSINPAHAGEIEALQLWKVDPVDNTATDRPAIVWIHGGGFKGGTGAGQKVIGTATEYARRGYLGFSIDYRLDPGSGCQEVQDDPTPDPAAVERCARAIIAAQHDAQAAVRWVRKNAVALGVDRSRVAVGGFSAGAVTAAHVAYHADDPGGSGNPNWNSRPNAAFGASGCSYFDAYPQYADPIIDPSDAPISLIASEHDLAVPYECVANTVVSARDNTVVADLTSYCDQRGHAYELYISHQPETDLQWTNFLARELGIYDDIPPWNSNALCRTAET